MTGNDDQASADGLSALKRHFGRLKAGEKCLLEEMQKGEVYHKSDEFLAIGIDRARRRLDTPKTVRSEFVRWICLSTKFHEQVRLRQITLFGFELTGCLDLESVTIPLPLVFKCCSFDDDVI